MQKIQACLTVNFPTQVGYRKLNEMLLNRNWDELSDTRVDRRYNKLGKIAQMLMDTDGTPPEEVKAALDQQIADLEAMRAAQGGRTPPPVPSLAPTAPKDSSPSDEIKGMRF